MNVQWGQSFRRVGPLQRFMPQTLAIENIVPHINEDALSTTRICKPAEA